MAKKTAKQSTAASGSRAPIVGVFGHIDHGKSSLLDYIRKTEVVAREAGGITQHIRAYEVLHKSDTGERRITFLDTPGHEAFQAMRARGARIADIAILVVAADDGAKPQTLEAWKAISEAGIPCIVAFSKSDVPNANVDRAKQSLAEHGILVEGYGGTTPWLALSSKTGAGVPELLDTILLVADVEGVRGDATGPAQGYVLESSRDPKSGSLATLVIKEGTLHTGDHVLAGTALAKIKKIEDFQGTAITEAHCAQPVRVHGFTEVPEAGSTFVSFSDKKEAERAHKEAVSTTQVAHVAPSAEAAGERFMLPLVIKADVSGSLEALIRELKKLETERVGFNIIGTGVGPITENDVALAGATAHSLVLGFTVKVERGAQVRAEKLGVPVASFDIIYKLTDWLREELPRLVPTVQSEEVIGELKVLKIFSEGKGTQIVGGEVLSGTVRRDRVARLTRRGSVIGGGRIVDLQKNKQSTREVAAGEQCGLAWKGDLELAPGDVLTVIEIVERPL